MNQTKNDGTTWIPAVEILQQLNNLWDIFLPLKILNIILDFVKAIYVEHTKAIRQQQDEKRKNLNLKECDYLEHLIVTTIQIVCCIQTFMTF